MPFAQLRGMDLAVFVDNGANSVRRLAPTSTRIWASLWPLSIRKSSEAGSTLPDWQNEREDEASYPNTLQWLRSQVRLRGSQLHFCIFSLANSLFHGLDCHVRLIHWASRLLIGKVPPLLEPMLTPPSEAQQRPKGLCLVDS